MTYELVLILVTATFFLVALGLVMGGSLYYVAKTDAEQRRHS